MISRMKTTIEIDEEKLETVMRLGGFKDAQGGDRLGVDRAERLARINQIKANIWTADIQGCDRPQL